MKKSSRWLDNSTLAITGFEIAEKNEITDTHIVDTIRLFLKSKRRLFTTF